MMNKPGWPEKPSVRDVMQNQPSTASRLMSAARPGHNQPLEWTARGERSLRFETWSVPDRPFNVSPLSGMLREYD